MFYNVEEYLSSRQGLSKAWLKEFIEFMRGEFPQISESISYQIPTYSFDGTYIAFSCAKNHFSLHTKDLERIGQLKQLLPHADFGKGCAKIKYTDSSAKPVLFEFCRELVAAHMDAPQS